MMACDMISNTAFGERLSELESSIKTCKKTFEALSATFISLKSEALGDKSAAISTRQQNYQATEILLRLDSVVPAASSSHEKSISAESSELNARRLDSGIDSFEFFSATSMEDSVKHLRTLNRDSITQGSWPATLRVDWPQSLSWRYAEIENTDTEAKNHIHNAINSMIQKTQEVGSLSAGISEILGDKKATRASMFVITPTHSLRLFLDICSIVCLCSDLVTIPFFLAWGVEYTGIFKLMQVAVMLFWTVDIIASFRTGFFHDGEVVTGSFEIAKRYLKGSFIVDVAVVLVDWIGFVADTSGNWSGIVGTEHGIFKSMRIGKSARVLRLIAVVRVAKVSDAFHRILDRNVSQSLLLGVEVLELIVVIVVVNHVLGCVWFALSQSYIPSDTGARWIDERIVGGGGRYDDATSSFQYLTAFHFALTQMTSGSMQINAQNSAERIFNISCVLFGLLFSSFLISTLSAKLMSMRVLHATRTSQINVMTEFLRERHVGSAMAFVIKRQVIERMQWREPVHQHNVEALKLLSERLQSELHMSICRPLISTNPAFVVIFRLGNHHASQICFRATTFMAMKRHDILFNAGGDCNDAYVVSQGSLEYVQTPETAVVFTTQGHRVDAGTWLCEASLWSEWIHVGTAECLDAVEVLTVNAARLIDTTKTNILLKTFVSQFGRAYHQNLTSSYAFLPHDLCGEVLDNISILSSMDKDCSMLISFISLQILRDTSSWRFSASNAQPLIEEVRSGQTTLVPRSDTLVHRCVHVSCLKLLREDGRLLVLLGTWDPSEKRTKASVKLPGTKLMGWEDPEHALARFIKEDLAGLERIIILEKFEKESEVQKSSNYGLLTDYSRIIFTASAIGLPEITIPPRPQSGRSSGVRISAFSEKSWQPFRKSHLQRDFTCFTFKNSRHMHVYAWLTLERFKSLTGTESHSRAEQIMQDFDIAEAAELSFESVQKTRL